MSAPDRSWTITSTLLWFGVALVAGLVIFDGNVSALAERLTRKREAPPAGANGPAFTATAVPESGDDGDVALHLLPVLICAHS